MKQIIFLVLPFIIALGGCESEEIVTEDLLESPLDVQHYFDLFESEAAKRNLNVQIDSKNIFAEFGNLEDNKIGQCSYTTNQPRKITLDQEYWNRASALEREYLVFHELGHCYLEKQHNDDEDDLGTCISIMNSGTSGCRNIYNSRNRTNYINELFDIK